MPRLSKDKLGVRARIVVRDVAVGPKATMLNFIPILYSVYIHPYSISLDALV